MAVLQEAAENKDFCIAETSGRPHTRFPSVKIITVEDDQVARAVLRQALRRLGHEVIEASDGGAAGRSRCCRPRIRSR